MNIWLLEIQTDMVVVLKVFITIYIYWQLS